MLDRIIFEDGISKLMVEYKDKGFSMSREKAAQWYCYMRDFSADRFVGAIDKCLKNCVHSPTMADMFRKFPEADDYSDYV